MDQKTHDKGLEIRKAVLGEAYVNNALKNSDSFNKPFQELVTEYCWGAVWGREELPRKTRSMLNLAMISILNRPHELKAHIKGALTNGVSRDEIREIFMQEAERRGLQRSREYLQRMELMRQGLLINELFADEAKRNPVTDKELRAEYDKLLAQTGGGKEYRARHILLDKEEDAKALIAKLKAGAKFEDLAKRNSKDTGSAESGGDLDWASPNTYVPEFSQAMVKLQKGQMTDAPVKSEHGWHIIRLDDVRENAPPPFEAVKPQIEQFVKQQRMAQFREDLRKKAKTDYKFSEPAEQPAGN